MAAQENGHVCDFKNCGKAFSKEIRLVEHKRMHTGEVQLVFYFFTLCKMIRYFAARHSIRTYFDANDLQRTWCVSRALIKSDEVPGIVFSEVATGDRKIWVFRGQNL